MSSSFIPNEADILSINSVSLQLFLDPDMEAFCCNPLDAGKQVGQIMIFFFTPWFNATQTARGQKSGSSQGK